MPILNLMDTTSASIRSALSLSRMLDISAAQLSQEELAEGLAALREKLQQIDRSHEAAFAAAAAEKAKPGQAPASLQLASVTSVKTLPR